MSYVSKAGQNYGMQAGKTKADRQDTGKKIIF
jgi:hypothetical protein